MEYKKQFDIWHFKFCSGAIPVVEEIKNEGKIEDLASLIEEVFCDKIPTETEINYFVWFERDSIFENLGIDEYED